MSETVAANLNQIRQLIREDEYKDEYKDENSNDQTCAMSEIIKKVIESYASHLPYPFI